MRVNGKRVFLSGPMTGKTSFGVADFAAAHERLNEAGAKYVFDPAFERYVEISNGKPEQSHEWYLSRTLAELITREEMGTKHHYEVLVLLPGWRDSDGAVIEADVARSIGIDVCELGDVE